MSSHPRAARMPFFETLARQHLDLSPLNGRRRGVVSCLFHEDRNPSFSIDLDSAVWNCFSCGEHGGARDFAEAVGAIAPRRLALVASPRETALRRVVQQRQRAEAWAPLYTVADYLRRVDRAIARARAVATRLGLDHPAVGDILELAADLELTAHDIEADWAAAVAAMWRAA